LRLAAVGRGRLCMPDCPLVDHRGRPVTVPNPHRNEWRVSAYAEELA